MSGTHLEDPMEKEHVEDTIKDRVDGDFSEVDMECFDKTEDNPMPTPEEEETMIKKKYGGIIPKKPPLISKDHERAFFDSADWALGKQGAPVDQKPKGPLEALRPKLQPTPHQQVRSRKSPYAPPDDSEDGGNNNNNNNNNTNANPEDQSCHE